MVELKLKARFSDPNSAVLLIRRLLTERALGQWKRYVVAFFFMALVAACTALGAYLIGTVIDQTYIQRNLNNVIMLGCVLGLIFIIKGAATYGQALMMARISNAIIAENQRRMYASLIQQNLAYYSERHTAELLSRLGAGATGASKVLSLLAGAIGRDLLSLIGLATVMVIQDPVMSLFGLLVIPPAMFFLRKLIRRMQTVAQSQFVGGVKLLETLHETVSGIRVVKAYTLEKPMGDRLDSDIDEVQRLANRAARVANRASPLMETLGGVAVALAVIYGGYRIIDTGAAPGQFVSFLAAFLLAYEPAKRLARLNLELTSSLVGVRILFDILDSPATEPADNSKPPLKLTTAQIEFKDVWFGYRPEEPVLRGMSFTAEPGRVTALVGHSGAGKSTVLNLVLRFYDAQSGLIQIDGQNIADVSRESLRQQLAYVGQDVFLFHGTIRENIAIGKPGATEQEIIAAAKAAHAHEFVSRFPDGYDTLLGERGVKISGGERQRVAIARALIKDAPVILLDEATAALDSESERLVQDAMAHLCQNRTTLVIAHRLHTIVHADRIVVVENGTVVESGRHEELLRKGGRYAAFYRLQVREQGLDAPIPIASNA